MRLPRATFILIALLLVVQSSIAKDDKSLDEFVETVRFLKQEGKANADIAAYVSLSVGARVSNANDLEGVWRRGPMDTLVNEPVEYFTGKPLYTNEGITTDRKFRRERDYPGGKNAEIRGGDYINRAKWTWDNRYGSCAESSSLTHYILQQAGIDSRMVVSPGHHYTVIGLDPNADISDPSTWGDDAYVVDGWQGQSYSATEARENYWIGNGGKTKPAFDTNYDIPKQREGFMARQKIAQTAKLDIARSKLAEAQSFVTQINQAKNEADNAAIALQRVPQLIQAAESSLLLAGNLTDSLIAQTKAVEAAGRELSQLNNSVDIRPAYVTGRFATAKNTTELAEAEVCGYADQTMATPPPGLQQVSNWKSSANESIRNASGVVQQAEADVSEYAAALYTKFAAAINAVKASMESTGMAASLGGKPDKALRNAETNINQANETVMTWRAALRRRDTLQHIAHGLLAQAEHLANSITHPDLAGERGQLLAGVASTTDAVGQRDDVEALQPPVQVPVSIEALASQMSFDLGRIRSAGEGFQNALQANQRRLQRAESILPKLTPESYIGLFSEERNAARAPLVRALACLARIKSAETAIAQNVPEDNDGSGGDDQNKPAVPPCDPADRGCYDAGTDPGGTDETNVAGIDPGTVPTINNPDPADIPNQNVPSGGGPIGDGYTSDPIWEEENKPPPGPDTAGGYPPYGPGRPPPDRRPPGIGPDDLKPDFPPEGPGSRPDSGGDGDGRQTASVPPPKRPVDTTSAGNECIAKLQPRYKSLATRIQAAASSAEAKKLQAEYRALGEQLKECTHGGAGTPKVAGPTVKQPAQDKKPKMCKKKCCGKVELVPCKQTTSKKTRTAKRPNPKSNTSSSSTARSSSKKTHPCGSITNADSSAKKSAYFDCIERIARACRDAKWAACGKGADARFGGNKRAYADCTYKVAATSAQCANTRR